MKLVFWASFLVIFYVYFGYPLLILAIARFFTIKFNKQPIEPPVTIIIAAYNEERDIAAKLENTLSLNYPQDRIEIIVGSDGSKDATNTIVGNFQRRGVKLVASEKNRGKTAIQNDCMRAASNDLIVFMDAASSCAPDALKKLIACFSDPRVGAVAGRIIYRTKDQNLVTESQGTYWRYEQCLKSAESKLGILVGVDGPLYAVRREVYSYLDAEIISDLMIPVLVRKMGRSVILEEDALCYEEPTRSGIEERKTRRRIVARGFAGLWRYRNLSNPFKYPCLAFQIASRKILRWFTVVFFISMLLASYFLLSSIIYQVALGCMVLILILAWIGGRQPELRGPLFRIPYYFTLVNCCALLGFFDFLRGRQFVSWKPVRKTD